MQSTNVKSIDLDFQVEYDPESKLYFTTQYVSGEKWKYWFRDLEDVALTYFEAGRTNAN